VKSDYSTFNDRELNAGQRGASTEKTAIAPCHSNAGFAKIESMIARQASDQRTLQRKRPYKQLHQFNRTVWQTRPIKLS
jgi:hypothetical protein